MNSRTTSNPTYEELAKAWREGYAAGWKDQECDFPPHTTENPYKEGRMKRNPFEIAFGIVLTVCLCVAPIIIFILD